MTAPYSLWSRCSSWNTAPDNVCSGLAATYSQADVSLLDEGDLALLDANAARPRDPVRR